MEFQHSVTKCGELITSHQTLIAQALNDFRIDNTLTDVIVTCNGKEFQAHRLILIAGSSYFKKIFLEKPTVQYENIEMNNIDSKIMEIILDFLYTGYLPVNFLNENYIKFTELFSAASALGITDLYKYYRSTSCERLDNRNFLEFWERSLNYDDESLLGSVIEFVNNNFNEIKNNDEFFKLSSLQLKSVLSGNNGQVLSSDDALKGVIDWINHDVDGRKNYFKDLFSSIDTSALSYNYLNSLTERDSWLTKDGQVNETLHELKAQKTVVSDINVDDNIPLALPQMTPDRRNMVLNTEIIHFGFGSDNTAYYQCLHLEKGWKKSFPLPFLMAKGCAILHLGNYFYFAGGKDNDCKPTSRVIKYDYEENIAIFIEPLLKAVWDAAIGVILGKIYVLGGNNVINGSVSVTDYVQCYDPSNASWSEITSLRVYRSLASTITVNDIMYIAGGYEYSDGNPCQRILHYSASNPRMNVITVPEPVKNIKDTTVVCLDKIYIARDDVQKAFLIYDPTTRAWMAKLFPGGTEKIDKMMTYSNKDELFPYILVIGSDGKILLLHLGAGTWHLIRDDYCVQPDSKITEIQKIILTGST